MGERGKVGEIKGSDKEGIQKERANEIERERERKKETDRESGREGT